ncbi:unnamed protein product [Rhizoctonia solani]|uniref:Uncharacterized protein n=1 Tax=Rhizoctonia solani TaxID=456999 RepID=A0A8H3AQW5_9AGAM|nr:unnamed protein product [Rhizoctonia solani]
MSAPSFSSFPAPTFSSFPDIEEPKPKEKEKEKEKRSKREERDRDKHKSHRDERDRHKDRRRSDRDRDRSRSPRRKEKDKDKSRDVKESSKHRDDRNRDERDKHSKRDKKAEKAYREEKRKERKGQQREKDKDTDSDEPGETYDFERDLANARKQQTILKGEQQGEYESLELSNLCMMDGKGDTQLMQYGYLDPGKVPRFMRAGYGNVLGAPAGWKIIRGRGSNRQVELGKGGRPPAKRYIDRRAIASTTRRLIPSKSAAPLTQEEEEEGFIRVNKRRKLNQDDLADEIDDSGKVKRRDEGPAYREITRANSDSSASEVSDSESDTELVTPELTRAGKLQARVKEYPMDISAWMALLKHNVAPARDGLAHAEMAVSVLSKALAAHPANRQSPSLRLRFLRAGEIIWPQQQVEKEWEEMLKDFPHNGDVWAEWVGWRMRVMHHVEGTIGDIAHAFNVLCGSTEELEMQRLRLFWKACVWLRQAGYVERAISAMQAQIEITFFPPSNRPRTFPDTLTMFEEFWDSEVPRIGEEGAQGWASWVSDSTGDVYDAQQVFKPSQDPPADPYQHWVQREKSIDSALTHPLRLRKANFRLDDPHRVVVLSDFSPILTPLITPIARRNLLFVCLHFLGLHTPGSTPPPDDVWADDRWMKRENDLFPEQLKSIGPRVLDGGALIGHERMLRPGWGPVKDWGWGVGRVVGAESDMAAGGRMWEAEDLAGVDNEFVSRVFALLSPVVQDEMWDEHWLAFEAVSNPKKALKISRTQLAEDQSSLYRWATHARLERARNKPAEASKIYRVNLAHVNIKERRPGELELWWEWSEMEWLRDKTDDTLQIIMMAVDVSSTNPTDILRAKRIYDSSLKDGILDDPMTSVVLVRLRALLELLTTDSLPAALAIYNHYLQTLQFLHHTTEHEALVLSATLCAFHHTRTLGRPCPPSVLRDQATAAIKFYPGNTTLLGLFLESERGEKVWGRVRAAVSDVILQEDLKDDMKTEVSLARVLWAVWVESWEHGSYEQERVRNVLSKAVNDHRMRHSPVLWRIYLEFEIRAGQLMRARTLLYQATNACPWVKDFYLLAFDQLRSTFTHTELDSWTNLMAERQIRMRTEIEELLVGWAPPDENSDSEVESVEGEAEIEERAQELRRLRPY